MIDITKNISECIKNHDTVKLNVFRDIKNEILKYKTSKNAKEYNDNVELSIIKKLISQRKDSIEQFVKANRIDLIEKEQKELDVLNELLPTPASEKEVIDAIYEMSQLNGIDTNVNYIEFIPKNKLGIIMKSIKDKFPQNDGGQIMNILKQYLIK